jgi:DNA-directed RNA polymerase alpha subunit
MDTNLPPLIKNIHNQNDVFTFTIMNVDVSIVNAMRRTILADIPTVVIITEPYDKNKCIIHENTCEQFHDQTILQRLSCIPIHVVDYENWDINKYQLEINVENTTEEIQYVTTKDFKIKEKETNTYLSEKETREIFPPNPMTNDYIDFLRLRPSFLKSQGEKIHLTSDFSISTSRDNAMFNVVSKCSYGNSLDKNKIDEELNKKIKIWKDEKKSDFDIELNTNDFLNLDAHRLFLPFQFDFYVQTVGVFTNNDIVNQCCSILINKFIDIERSCSDQSIFMNITMNETTLDNSFKITMTEDYSIGNIIVNSFFQMFNDKISFCGFIKLHPHDETSILTVAFHEKTDNVQLSSILSQICKKNIILFQTIQSYF